MSDRTRETGIQTGKDSIVNGQSASINPDSKSEITDNNKKITPESAELPPAQIENSSESFKAHTASPGERVLVMDDEDVIRDMARIALKKLGYQVEVACGGDEAIELYKKGMDTGYPFNLVIMDVTIPGGIGAKLTIKKLLKIDANAKVIVSSGYHNDPIMANYSDYGFKANIIKPYDVHELEKTLHIVISSPDNNQLVISPY
jgi:CheY-like chemotaxis protein